MTTIYESQTGGDTKPSHVAYAKLPAAPQNLSPVPHLTSLYHRDASDEERQYGDRKYPGNCGGNLIRDLLLFHRPKLVLDPMTGSGTCRDVCQELKIRCISSDIREGRDAGDPQTFAGLERSDFVWLHPPYWRQKLYTRDPHDLSNCPTLEAFYEGLQRVLTNAFDALAPGGRVAVLMGDYHDREAGFIPLTYHTKRLAFNCGLRQPGIDIIRFLHGTTSSKKVYRTSFIPTLHDVCMMFQRPK